MSITDVTLDLTRSMRLELDMHVDDTTRAIARQWSAAWDELSAEWRDAISDLLTKDGWPSRSKVLRAERAQRALRVTREALDELAKQAGVRIVDSVPAMVEAMQAWQQSVAASQLPYGGLTDWARVDDKALQAIVKRTAGQVEKITRRLPREQQAVMKQTLIRGVAVGDSPREAARTMMSRLGGRFDGGRRRAETIARTEMLDASRASARAGRMANADVLAGWTWTSTLDRRTCPACLGMHGTEFPLDAPGPEGHQNCRCVAVERLKPWRDLGFDMDDMPSELPNAREWWESQPVAVQNDIMGAERARRLRSGDLSWDQLAVRRDNPGWRPSWTVRPLGQAA